MDLSYCTNRQDTHCKVLYKTNKNTIVKSHKVQYNFTSLFSKLIIFNTKGVSFIYENSHKKSKFLSKYMDVANNTLKAEKKKSSLFSLLLVRCESHLLALSMPSQLIMNLMHCRGDIRHPRCFMPHEW